MKHYAQEFSPLQTIQTIE